MESTFTVGLPKINSIEQKDNCVKKFYTEMNIAKCVMVLSQSFRKNTADGLNKSGTKPPKLYSQQHQQMDSISNSQEKRSKSFFEILITKIKWLLRPFRNKVANSNPYQRWYIFGWVTIICGFLPSTTLLIFAKTTTWLIYGVWLPIFSFIIGFAIEALSIWKKRSKELIIVFSVIGTITTFISKYAARWIIVYITKIEPVNSSRASIFFLIVMDVVFWLGIAGLFLLLIYLMTLALQIFTVAPFNIINVALIRNQGWYRFCFRKPKDTDIEKKVSKVCCDFFLFGVGRAIGAGLWFVIIVLILSPLISVIYEFSKAWLNLFLKETVLGAVLLQIMSPAFITSTYILSSFWTHIAEDIIVYSDYRPENFISECTNLEHNEKGLLIGYKKISVAKPQETGGYIFTTKPCLFEDIIPNKQ